MRKFIVWIWLSRRARPKNRTGRWLEEVAEKEREIRMEKDPGRAFPGGPGRRGCRFNPCSEKIPRASGQLSPCTKSTKPVHARTSTTREALSNPIHKSKLKMD